MRDYHRGEVLRYKELLFLDGADAHETDHDLEEGVVAVKHLGAALVLEHAQVAEHALLPLAVERVGAAGVVQARAKADETEDVGAGDVEDLIVGIAHDAHRAELVIAVEVDTGVVGPVSSVESRTCPKGQAEERREKKGMWLAGGRGEKKTFSRTKRAGRRKASRPRPG